MDVHEFSWKTAPVAMDMFLFLLIKNYTTILDDGFFIQQSQQSQIFSPQSSASSKLPVAAPPINSFHFEVQQRPGQTRGVTFDEASCGRPREIVLSLKTYSPSTWNHIVSISLPFQIPNSNTGSQNIESWNSRNSLWLRRIHTTNAWKLCIYTHLHITYTTLHNFMETQLVKKHITSM